MDHFGVVLVIIIVAIQKISFYIVDNFSEYFDTKPNKTSFSSLFLVTNYVRSYQQSSYCTLFEQ